MLEQLLSSARYATIHTQLLVDRTASCSKIYEQGTHQKTGAQSFQKQVRRFPLRRSGRLLAA